MAAKVRRKETFKYKVRDFPGAPVAKTPLHSQSRGPGFSPWSGN